MPTAFARAAVERASPPVATIEMQSRYAPVARDARAILRQKSLLGETFVELTPGHPKSAGSWLPEVTR